VASLSSRWVIVLVVTGLLAQAACFVVYSPLLVSAAWSCWPDPFDAQPFSPQAWANAGQEARAAMARDAIRQLRPGMTEAEALALLGKSGGPGGPEGRARSHWYYLDPRCNVLSAWHWDVHDTTYLDVHIDAEGRVTGASIEGM
jgi:hypothetical protein